jgi:hypothetical protein
MTGVVDIYTAAVYDNLRPLRANWEPSQPVKLGDYGLLDGQAFIRQGDIADLGFAAGNAIADAVGDHKMFTSSKDVTIEFTGKGAAAAGLPAALKAGLRISFPTSETAFFNAADCTYEVVADKQALGEKIMAAYAARKWRREWAVVTDLVRSRSTTIAIATSAGASLEVEATATWHKSTWPMQASASPSETRRTSATKWLRVRV